MVQVVVVILFLLVLIPWIITDFLFQSILLAGVGVVAFLAWRYLDVASLDAMSPEAREAELERRQAKKDARDLSASQIRDFARCRNCGATEWHAIGGPKVDSRGTPYARFECGNCGARSSLYRLGFGKKWSYKGL